MTTYQIVFNEQLGQTNEPIVVTIEYDEDFNGDGFNDIRITLDLTAANPPNSGTEDIIGVAFDIGGNLVTGLEIEQIIRSTYDPPPPVSTFVPTYVISANNVGTGGGFTYPGFDTDGGGSDQPYDVGIKFSENGSGEGIVQAVSFVLTNDNGSLDAENLLNGTDWFIRLQSTDGGSQSAKTAGGIIELPPDGGGGNPPLAELTLEKDTVCGHDDGESVADGTVLEGSEIAWVYTLSKTDGGDVYNVVVSDDVLGTIYDSGVLDPDSLGLDIDFSGDDGDDILEDGENWVFKVSGTATTGAYSNTASASGTDDRDTAETEDDAGVEAPDATSSYFGADPSLDVEKYVSVDGGITWVDADAATGPLLGNASGIDPQFKFVVQNTGNVDLTNILLDDDTFDLNGDDPGGDILIASLTADDGADGGTDSYELIITGTWQAGQHTNVATVSLVDEEGAPTPFTDDCGNTRTVGDSDAANYFGVDTGTFGRTAGFWSQHLEAWDGKSNNDGRWQNLVNSGVLSKPDVLPNSLDYTPTADWNGSGAITNADRGILLGDANGNGAVDANECTIWIQYEVAKFLIPSSLSGNSDVRQILLRQAVAAQLNVYNGDPDPGAPWNVDDAGDLVGEAACWVLEWADINHDGILTLADLVISGKKAGTFTDGGLSASDRTAAWSTPVDLDGIAVDLDHLDDILVTGEGLKNVLEAFNQNLLVASADGTAVGWNVSPTPETSVILLGVVPDTPDNFWHVAFDFGLSGLSLA